MSHPHCDPLLYTQTHFLTPIHYIKLHYPKCNTSFVCVCVCVSLTSPLAFNVLVRFGHRWKIEVINFQRTTLNSKILIMHFHFWNSCTEARIYTRKKGGWSIQLLYNRRVGCHIAKPFSQKKHVHTNYFPKIYHIQI